MLPDSSDLQDISQGGEDIYFKKIYYEEIQKFYSLLIKKLSSFNSKIFLGNLVNFEKLDFGTFTKKMNSLRYNLIIKLNQFLLNKIKENNFYLLDMETLVYKWGVNQYRDKSRIFIWKNSIYTRFFKLFLLWL